MAQISHLQQQLVGQVIDSHFSIYVLSYWIVGTEKELLFLMVYGMVLAMVVLAMVVTAVVKRTFSSVVFMLLCLIKYT